MALQMVSPVLSVLGNSLSSPIMEELGLLWGVGTELEQLTSTVSALQSVLDDAEEKQLNSKAISDWLLKLKNAAYDADDILDEWATESGGTQQEHTTLITDTELKFVITVGELSYLLYITIAGLVPNAADAKVKWKLI